MSQPYNNYENYSPELGNGVTINQPPHPGVYSPSAPDMDPYSYINPNFNPYQPEVVVPPPYPSIHAPSLDEDFYISPNYVRNLPILPPPYPGLLVPPEPQPHVYENPNFLYQQYPIASIGLHADIRDGNIYRRKPFRVMSFAIVSTFLLFVIFINVLLYQAKMK
ncbi:hypothetical protein CAEBREN_02941 [Caenorhabditis brenneri]|uniref:Uncharacterized protein n=1 Tax=Caenorhabditis brenneri TaxID=135651 RepID=G0PHB7_CAEBE|nr:hypothetical protein CAEBREN_02941 [Caenorhabditis brenneri]